DQAATAIAAFLFRTGGARRVVAARTEGAVAGAGQHDDADVAVVLGVAHRLQHLFDRLGAKRVQHLRPVDRDRRDAVALVVEDVVIGHGAALPGSMPTRTMRRRHAASKSNALPLRVPGTMADEIASLRSQ